MPEVYVPLHQAAELEGIPYNTLVQRMKRSPQDYKTKTEPRENGGKAQVSVALSSLSVAARKAYRAAQKVDGRDVVIERKAQETPWYLDIDQGWYISKNRERYYAAVELAREVGRFVAYSEGERTAYAEAFAGQLGVSTRSLYRYAEDYLEASAWALRLEKEEGKSYDYLKILALCRKPRESQTFPSITPELRAAIENIWFDKRFSENLGTIEMLHWKLHEIAGERGWESIPSYPTVTRYIGHLMDARGGRSAKFLAANGMREWKNKQMLKGKRDATALAVMELLMGDGHTFDLWVQYTHPNGKVVAVRPKLAAWIDVRSRCIMGDVMCLDFNAQTTKESLVKAIYGHPGGVPKHLLIDNGKEYTAKTVTGQNRKERVMLADAESEGFVRSLGIEDWSRARKCVHGHPSGWRRRRRRPREARRLLVNSSALS